VCAVFVFVTVILLGARSTESGREEDWQFWFENATQVQFPGFHLRLNNADQYLSTYQCTYLGQPLNINDCSYGGDRTKCIAVDTKNVVVKNQYHEPDTNRQITCQVYTAGVNTTVDNLMMSWELDPAGHEFVANGFYSTMIAPNNNAWVNLEKWAFSPYSGNSLGKGETFHIWRRRVSYHSTISNNTYYSVTSGIEHFAVQHFTQTVTYDGWMSMGDVGGFAFFLLILHSIVMLCVGIFLANDSKFLGASEHHGAYSSGESAPLARG
jgi:hypothetical protein